jgi:hypothetical protein
MSRSLLIVLATASSLWAAPAWADWNPGALLDRADLDNLYVHAGRLNSGIRARINGVKNPSPGQYSVVSSRYGRIVG